MDGVKGFLIDLDGTLYQDGALIPGAKEIIEALRTTGRTVRFITNTTRKSRAMLVEDLNAMGLRVEAEEIFTAPLAAAAWLRHRGVERISLLLSGETFVEFSGFTIDDAIPQAVVVGDLGSAWNYEILNRAFRQLMQGAELVAIQKNRYWKTEGGLSLDAGPFVAALEYAAGKEAIVVGNPSRTFFERAVESMGLVPAETAMVGDDIESDVGGAQAAGLKGILVRTGKFTPKALEGSSVRPDLVLDTIADLV